MRVKIPKKAYRLRADGSLYITDQAGLTVKVMNADGSVGANATGYTTATGGALVTYPLMPNAAPTYDYTGWYAVADYWLVDANGDAEPWPAMSASDLGGRILAEAVITTVTAAITSVYPVRTAITGLSLDWVTTGQPIIVETFLPTVMNQTDQARTVASIMDGSTELTYATMDASGTNAFGRGMSLKIETETLTPAAGVTKTYSISGSVISGTARIGGANPPKALLRVRAA